MRRFIIEGEEVLISENDIKKYYQIGQCFLKAGEEIIPVQGNIYISEDGTLCDCDHCKADLKDLVDEEGVSITSTINVRNLPSVEGFIFNDKLNIVEVLEEV